jgi:hypothetical protein
MKRLRRNRKQRYLKSQMEFEMDEEVLIDPAKTRHGGELCCVTILQPLVRQHVTKSIWSSDSFRVIPLWGDALE